MKKTIYIINQYASTPNTGLGGRSYYLGKELANLGYQIYLITATYTHLHRSKTEEKSIYTIEKEENFHIVWIKTNPYKNAHSLKRITNWILFSWRLLKTTSISNTHPNTIIVSSPSPFPFLSAYLLAKKNSAKLIFEVRDIWPLTLRELGGYKTYNPIILIMGLIENLAYKKSNTVISNLPYAIDHMVTKGLNPEKFRWIPNGISQDATDRNLNTYTQTQIPLGKFIVGYAGTIGLANALETLVTAAKTLKSHKSIAIVIVGKGKKLDSLKEFCNKNKLNNVYFLGAISKNEVNNLLSNFDCLYLGAKKTTLYRYGIAMNKLFDYFLAGKPIIYAINSGKYEPIKEANAGISIEPEDPEGLVSAILKLQSLSSTERLEMGENGKNYVLKNHDYSKIAAKLAELL
jgi:glycosyltransferase involved in cell wall biosynthesis